MVRKYVSWSRQEWIRLSDLVWAIKKNNPGKKLPKLIRMALQQFPPDRARSVNEDIVGRVRSGLAYRDQQESMGADRAVPPTINNAIDAKPPVVKQEQFKELPIPCDIGKTDTATLIVELLKRAEAYLSSKGSVLTDALTSIAESLSQKTPVKVDRPAYAPPAPKEVEKTFKEKQDRPEKVRVVLVGGLSIQQQEIASRICDIAKIRFIDKNRTSDLGISNGSQDIIAIMTSFVDHSTVHQVKAQANGARVLELRGNASGVARDIRACILNPEARPCTHS